MSGRGKDEGGEVAGISVLQVSRDAQRSFLVSLRTRSTLGDAESGPSPMAPNPA